MSIDTVVRAACKAIFGGRFYPSTFMQKDGGLPQFPSGRYTFVGGTSHPDLCGSDDGTTDDARVQIDIAATTHAERGTLLTGVMVAMQGLDPPCTRDEAPILTYDEETRTYRAILFYTFAPSSATT